MAPPPDWPRACASTSVTGTAGRSLRAFLAKPPFLAAKGLGPLPLLRLGTIVRGDPIGRPSRNLRRGGDALDAFVGIHPSRRFVVRERRLERIRVAARLVDAQAHEHARHFRRHVEVVALGLIAVKAELETGIDLSEDGLAFDDRARLSGHVGNDTAEVPAMRGPAALDRHALEDDRDLLH